MGFVPGYENDVFISYAHIDNEPVIPGKAGWVEFFEDLLRKRIRVRLGSEVAIFRDPQMRKFGEFSDQLARNVTGSAVFLSILSPRYVQADWCLWELERFIRHNEGSDRDRIIKVVKTAFDPKTLSDQARPLIERIERILDNRFYKKDESSGLFIDLQPETITEHLPAYYEKIEVLAQNLVELLNKLRDERSTAQPARPVPQNQIAVYLSETTKDLIEERNGIRTELLQFNYRVLPDKPLPRDAQELDRVVRDCLQQAKLAVNLIGANYGARPEGEDRSIPHLQFDLATERAKEGLIEQLIWMPPSLEVSDPNQQRFIAGLREQSHDHLLSKLEDLKTAIHKKLRPDPLDGPDEVLEEDVNVCLFCQEEDLESVRPIFSHLTIHEMFKVKLPLKDAQSFENHKQMLQASDGVLLYYGTGDDDWFVNIWKLIQRHVASSRNRAAFARAIYAGHPPTTEKELLASDDPMIIRHYGKFNSGLLQPFIDRVRAVKGTA